MDRRGKSQALLGDALYSVNVRLRLTVRNPAHAILMIWSGARGPILVDAAARCETTHSFSALTQCVSANGSKALPQASGDLMRDD
jgi:hypothetical protein